jgi:vacuolar-type H+-ATPase subunit I/STV1
MRMQEPEQWQQSGQEWQANQEFGEYRADYSEGYESEQQQQKIYPQEEQRLNGTALGIFAIILSSIGFFLTVAGIVASAIVLKYANGQQAVLVGGIIGLLSSIGAMLICVAIFVVSVVVLALRTRRVRRRK